MKALITAGPTHEPIDPVRFIGNRSSGKMGFAIAKALAKKGIQVTLIAGPVQLETPLENIHRIDVETAREMFEACKKHLDYDVAFMSAAVADFTPLSSANQKIKKKEGQQGLTLELTKTQDILQYLGDHKKPEQVLVGFSLETHDAETNALGKLARKKADYIVMNTLQDEGAGFGHDTNKVTLYGATGYKKKFDLTAKEILAEQLVDSILG